MPIQPNDYVNRAALGVNVAKNWNLTFPQYTVNFCTLADFEALHQNFLTQATVNKQQDINKKLNTENLKAANQTITKSIKRLKEYIRDEYNINAESQYAAYGLEKSSSGNYTFPTDNDRREYCLSIFLNKLKTPNDPIASKNQGLSYWEPLILTHATEWNNSKNIKSLKTAASDACKTYYKQSGNLLGKLHKQISIDFEKSKVAATRRMFGFLNETYK